MDGVDAVSEVPADRWDGEALYDANPEAPGKSSSRWGAFLGRLEEFDAQFFGISPREAIRMDPQQRLLLEVAWEALEDAGQPVERLAGREAGVFVGIHSLSSDYFLRQAASLPDFDVYTSTGVAHSIMANRLSYLLDLRGPSLAVDTACSSSLVAVHLACQSLRLGECDLALAGGVNLLSPEATVAFSKLNMMAADGRCKTFDARADGFVRGEGGGLVVLRRLADALAAGDPIVAVIRGTAVNQDGATNGITAPSGPAQEAVVRRALKSGGTDPGRVSFVETHGTGTALGDPIEVEALAKVLGRGNEPCVLGAVKTNIGHLEAAAGIAGLIKAALCLRHRFIPANLHFRSPNPHLELEQTRFVVPTEGRPWASASGALRLAGVSSFGFGGTNAHVVLEEAPVVSPSAAREDGSPLALPFSARSAQGLRALAADYAALLAQPDADRLSRLDVAYTAGVRRSHLPYREAVVGASREEWIAALRHLAERPVRSGPPEHPAGLVFAYSGQGPQWPGMGLGLYRREAAFREVLDRADHDVRRLAGWSLLEALEAPEPEARLRRTDVAQPALFALQAGLTELVRSWGVEPDAILGHSAGEVAAAWAAGVLSFDDALRVAVERGRLMQEATGQGEMAAIELPLEGVEAAIASFDGAVEIASVNSPTSTVIAGEPGAVEAVIARLEERAVFCKRLNTGFAFHSRQMERFQNDLVRALKGVSPLPAQTALYSTLTGRRAEAADYGPRYWARGIRERVRFSDAVTACAAEGHEAFLEIGPHPVLSPMIRRCTAAAGRDLMTVASLRKKEDEAKAMLEALSGLYRLGHTVDWSRCLPAGGRVRGLPTYPWQRKRFWVEDTRLIAPSSPRNGNGNGNGAAATPARDLAGLTYSLEWPRRERLTGRAPEGPGSWLILADRAGVGAALAARLQERGETCVTVFADPTGSATELHRVLHEWKCNGVPRRGVVHLWSLDAPPTDHATPETLEHAHALGCVSALHVARALVASPGPRLWLLTRGGQPANAAPHSLEVTQSAIWGFGRAFALEHPDAWGGLADLDRGSPLGAAARLFEEITAPDGEDQVVFRGEERRVARLVRVPVREVAPTKIVRDGSYLITGGLGALGLHVARWMAQQGARHLVLTSRVGLDQPHGENGSGGKGGSTRVEAVRALEALGVSVTVVVADASDAAAMAGVFHSFGRALPPLRGIVHAAGLMSARTIADLEPATLLQVMRPKVTGAWILHQLSRELELDFFVLFSSVSALLGSRGLAHYAAANEFLDGLAQHRRSLGLPAVALDWGPWAGEGMASGRDIGRLGPMLMQPLDVAEGVGAMGALLGGPSARVSVAKVDWSLFKPVYQGKNGRHLLDEIEGGAGTEEGSPAKETPLRRRLREAAPGERGGLVTGRVAEEVARTLGFDSPDTIDHRQGFFKLGMDSIMTVRLGNSLEASLGCRLPPTVAFEYPTVEALAGFILKVVAPSEAPLTAPPPKLGPTAEALPEHLSEEELTALLSDKLKETADTADVAMVPIRNRG
jgi:acyl transferase domain-containing protein